MPLDLTTDYSPWDLLPAPEPRTVSPPINYFYDKVSKHLITDMIKIMLNGIPINLDKVQKLEKHIDTVLTKQLDIINNNKYVKQYFEQQIKVQTALQKDKLRSKCKPKSAFLSPFKHNDMVHRSYFMHLYAQSLGLDPPSDALPTGIPKWPIVLIKKRFKSNPLINRLLSGKLIQHTLIDKAMDLLAEHKAEMYNRKYLDQLDSLSVTVEFNPNSSVQKHELLTDMLGLESSKYSDAYEKYLKQLNAAKRYHKPIPSPPKSRYSWGKEQLSELASVTEDPDLKELLNALVDYSVGNKIKTAFIPSFYKYTLKGRLLGNITLHGAKSYRNTANNPNLLQLPSTGSIYAKPVKECLVAPKGKVIYTIDYAALTIVPIQNNLYRKLFELLETPVKS